MSNLTFHHFGLAVKKPAEAIAFLSSQGYRLGEPVFDPLQNVHLIMGRHDGEPAVEIIYPAESPSPIDNLVSRHGAGIIYHVCYETGDLAITLQNWEASGLRAVCVSPPKPALLFEGQRVSFYTVVGIGLVEILQAAQT